MADEPISESPKQKLERFEDLARKLLTVPKAEVDAADAAREKRKPRDTPGRSA